MKALWQKILCRFGRHPIEGAVLVGSCGNRILIQAFKDPMIYNGYPAIRHTLVNQETGKVLCACCHRVHLKPIRLNQIVITLGEAA